MEVRIKRNEYHLTPGHLTCECQGFRCVEPFTGEPLAENPPSWQNHGRATRSLGALESITQTEEWGLRGCSTLRIEICPGQYRSRY